MLNFYFCKKYSNNVSNEADKVIRRKIADLEKRNNLINIPSIYSYGGVYVLRTNSPTTNQTIIQEEKIDLGDQNVSVLFVQDIIDESNSNYYAQIRNGNWNHYYPITEEDKEGFKKEFEEKKTNFSKHKSLPPSALTEWIMDYKINIDYDIYEMESWVKFAMSNVTNDGMRTEDIKVFCISLVDIIINKAAYTKKTLYHNENGSTYYFISNNIGVIYSELNFSEIPKPVFLLHNGAHVMSQKEHWNNLINSKEYANIPNIDTVKKNAIKAYPAWVLNNDDLWSNIQKNSETGNLSLLPEQTDFLSDFKFPSYITGQAGSGKSTMLYYLFANTYYYKCLGEIKGDLIFLTENEGLLKYTQKSIIELLQCNPEFELSSEDIINVDKHFKSFKDFLIGLLTNESDKKIFDQFMYLSFSKFKYLYENSAIPNNIKVKYTAEAAWFAINTYIYGYDLKTKVTSGNYYDVIPKKSRILSKDFINEIEKSVLPFYDKLLSQGYWDKITIIRYITDNVVLNKKYEVIFCDEAQDFSRVELRFILYISEYMQYDLSNAPGVPIVFAGDALQTVRPTGFRYSEVTDMLYEELKEIAGFDLKTNSMSYNPTYNYRSSQQIVNIANAVQYFRKNKFKDSIESPQRAKMSEDSEDSCLNVFLSYEDVIDEVSLAKKLQYKSFIIPVNIDEKEDYVKKYPFLQQFESTIKTSIEAKGIDYKEVVLYGFGEYFIEHYGDYNININYTENSDSYNVRFFFNKLYVAATRARLELVIIDSSESKSNFWKLLIDDYAKSDWAKESEIAQYKIKDTICYGAGQISDIKNSSPETALENARKDKEQALLDNNTGLLRVAANQFLKMGYKKEYYLCLALKNRIEENWKEAVTYFLKKEVGTEGLEEAAKTYWEGQLLEPLQNMSGLKGEEHATRLLVAELFTKNTLTPHENRSLYEHRSTLNRLLKSITWRDKVISKLIYLTEQLNNDDQLKDIIAILEEISTDGDIDVWKKIGDVNHKLLRYEAAIIAWDKINYEGLLYYHAKSELEKRKENYSNYIVWVGMFIMEAIKEEDKIKNENDIISAYNANKTAIQKTNNIYTYLYVYGAALCRCLNDTLLIELGQIAEKSFAEIGKELVDYYQYLLESKRLPNSIINFVIDRWVKNAFKIGYSIEEINKFYGKIALENKKQYIPFCEEQIAELTEYPVLIHNVVSDHIETMRVKNFRKFSDVKVENLGLFNLIVGDNNIGKTSLLEAFLFTPNKEEYILRLSFSYINRCDIQPDKDKTKSSGQRFYYALDKKFIEDFKNNNNSNNDIEFIIEQKRNYWHYCIQNQTKGNETTQAIDFTTLSFTNSDYSILEDIPFLDAIKQPFMPYGKGYSSDLAQIYLSEIGSNRITEEQFIANMRLFIPGILRVIPDTKNETINIRDENFEEDCPLYQYGEGANKLFRILVLLTLHKGKRIMIDEIDAGIHFTRFEIFWRTILLIAQKDNTQIIATTHNDECIQYFNEILEKLGKDYQKESRIVQCKMVGDNLKIRTYIFDDFNIAIQNGFETRGGDKWKMS